jgi:hypothetical protein
MLADDMAPVNATVCGIVDHVTWTNGPDKI